MKLIIKYFFITLVLLGSNTLLAQNSSNPFELKHRLDKEVVIDAEKEAVDNRIIKTDNPFDIAEQPIEKPATITRPIAPIEDKEDGLPKAEVSKNYLIAVFFVVLAFFTAVISIARKKLEQSYRAFLNDNFLRQLHRVNQGSFSLSYFLLYLSFFLNVGIFIYLAANYFGANLPQNIAWVFLVCLGVALAFLFKHLLLFFIQSVFPISKEIKLYSFSIMVFSIILGIVLLPVNILAAFAPIGLAKIAILGGLGAIIATYLFRSIRGISIASKYIMLHSFHFLLYLCAVEILPVVVLLKFILLRMN
ncbi:MAG: DUF4271 domain-containing protein [Saprospiraceae bacterium]